MNEKIIARIRKLLGEDSGVTDEQIEGAFKGTNLVDLSDGGYISEEKHERLLTAEKTKVSAAETELKDLKAATDGDDGLKKQLATITAERDDLKTKLGDTTGDLTKAERKLIAVDKLAHLSPKLRRLAVQDAEELVSETVDFKAALDKVIADDPDYAAPDDDNDEEEAETTSTRVKVGTGKPPKGKSTGGGDDEAFDSFMAGVPKDALPEDDGKE